METSEHHSEIVKEVLAGNHRAVARLISVVESGSRQSIPFLRELFPFTGKSFTIGVTGAPGAGKSTLVDRLAEIYRTQGKRVGIIAIDPTSPFTGGAILGDRIRMQSRSVDPGTFIRSMATRGHMGGLAGATADALMVIDAAGFDIVIIETVGVGQGEVEIAETADATLVLLVPGMGDDIQNMKAGIMEIADIFVVNKFDRPGADKTESELRALLAFNSRTDGWKPSIIRAAALENMGIKECVDAIEVYRSFRQKSEIKRKQILQRQKSRIIELFCRKAHEILLQDADEQSEIEKLAVLVTDRKIDPYAAADTIWDKIAEKIAKRQAG
jgi:LAO/AO transport system kinase